MVDRLRLSRAQIAKIVGNDPEAIRQFEKLFAMGNETDNNTQFLEIAAALADGKATAALAGLQSLADSSALLDTAPTPQANNAVSTDYIDLNLNPKHESAIGRVNWNNFDQTIEAGLDYDVVQQIGLETYVRVQNVTGVTIPNGTLVGFSGVGGAGEIQVVPYIADGTMPSLYVIGVMTHDLPDSGQTGYCTIVGKVRGIDTSAWNVGDILYASPTTAGALTNVKPNAPNNVIPVAAVLVDAVDGTMNVRPTIEQQKYYGEFTNTTSITPAAANTAYALAWPNSEIALGVSIASSSRITFAHAGLYSVTTRMQYTSGNANTKAAWLWYKLNGTTDYVRSAAISTMAQNGGYLVIQNTQFFSLAAGDYLQVMWAVNDVGLTPANVAATAFAPSSPTGRVSVTQVQQ